MRERERLRGTRAADRIGTYTHIKHPFKTMLALTVSKCKSPRACGAAGAGIGAGAGAACNKKMNVRNQTDTPKDTTTDPDSRASFKDSCLHTGPQETSTCLNDSPAVIFGAKMKLQCWLPCSFPISLYAPT